MKLYMIPTCPFVQRVLIACEIRGIPKSALPLSEINLSAPPQELLLINPTGSVPTLEIEPGIGFHESLIITEFLDSLAAPGPKLFGSSATETAMIKVQVETAINTLLNPILQAIYSRGDSNAIKKAEASIHAGYEWLEKTLAKKSGAFLGGSKLNAADVALAPFIARLPMLFEKYPNLSCASTSVRVANYIKAITLSPEVIASLPSVQDMRDSMLRFIEPHPMIQAAIDAPRSLIDDPKAALKLKGTELSCWKVEHDGKGFCLSAQFEFKNHADAVQKLNWLHNAQETTDHHTSFILKDFLTLDITLVTHEPRWGVTQKDLALATAIQAYFKEGQLP